MVKSIDKEQLQFELWSECNSNCTFCYLGKEKRHTPIELKVKNLDTTLQMISDESIYERYDTLAYLGGEFFQGQLNTPEIKEKFFKLMQKTEELYEKGLIKEIWLYATMTIGDQQDLFDTLEIFKSALDNGDFWVLTSYDTRGRFHSQKMHDTWDSTMLKLREIYPKIKLNVTSILSADLIRKYMNDEFSFQRMMDKYKCVFFLKQGYVANSEDYLSMDAKMAMQARVGDFFPKRKDFLHFLIKFKKQESSDMWNRLFNIKYRASTLYRNYNTEGRQFERNTRHKDSKVEEEGAALAKCGHVASYSCYIDSDRCCLCDKLAISDDG